MEVFGSHSSLAEGIMLGFSCCEAFLVLCVGFVSFLALHIRYRRKKNRQLSLKDDLAFESKNPSPAAATVDRTNSSVPDTFFNRNSANLLISLAVATAAPTILLVVGIANRQLLLSSVAAYLLSISAFFAAFFSRTTAGVFAGVSLVMMTLDIVLMKVSDVTFVDGLGFAILELFAALSIASIVLPLRRADKELPGGSRLRGKPRWLFFAFACLIAILITGYFVRQLLDAELGEQKTMALLSGDESIHFDRFEIDYQQRQVICTDPEILDYLEERFLKADRDRDELGILYRLTLYYKRGGHNEIKTYFNGNFILCLRNYHDEGMRPSHGILLTSPRAQTIDELASFLEKDYREVAGTVLILDSGTVRYERDESLVAGYGVRQSRETGGLNPWYAKAIVLLAAIVMVVIRAPHGSRSRTVPVVKNRKGPLETLLLTIAWFAFFLPLVWIVSPFLDFADYTLFPIPFITGILCLMLGLWLFYRSHQDLGTNWSITLEVREKHQLITHGIYRRIRHPMYLALLIYSLGQGLVLPNWLLGPSYGIAILLIFAFRVGREERMMLEEFGIEYEAYRARSKRLIPGIW
jgi:protein-S-isoprenylcysteine O-methyltransferase Ste14